MHKPTALILHHTLATTWETCNPQVLITWLFSPALATAGPNRYKTVV